MSPELANARAALDLRPFENDVLHTVLDDLVNYLIKKETASELKPGAQK